MIRSLRNARPFTVCRCWHWPLHPEFRRCRSSRKECINSLQRRCQSRRQLFKRTCALCHGADARGTDRGPSLVNSAELRSMRDSDISNIIRKGKAKMPAFPLPAADIDALTRFVRSLSPAEVGGCRCRRSEGRRKHLLWQRQCSTCHMVRGRGSTDWTRPFRCWAQAEARGVEAVVDLIPDAKIPDGWGSDFRNAERWKNAAGFARAQGSHDLVLQTNDGKLHLLLDSEYKALIPDKHSAMPAYKGTEDEQRDLVRLPERFERRGCGTARRSRNAAYPGGDRGDCHPRKETGRPTTARWMATATAALTR
jgi:cytochrome c oxidase cbb3-type subunit III